MTTHCARTTQAELCQHLHETTVRMLQRARERDWKRARALIKHISETCPENLPLWLAICDELKAAVGE